MEKETEKALIELVQVTSESIKTIADILADLVSRVSKLENK